APSASAAGVWLGLWGRDGRAPRHFCGAAGRSPSGPLLAQSAKMTRRKPRLIVPPPQPQPDTTHHSWNVKDKIFRNFRGQGLLLGLEQGSARAAVTSGH